MYESLFFLTQDENSSNNKNGKAQLLKCDKSFVLQNLENYELYRYLKLFSQLYKDESNIKGPKHNTEGSKKDQQNSNSFEGGVDESKKQDEEMTDAQN